MSEIILTLINWGYTPCQIQHALCRFLGLTWNEAGQLLLDFGLEY